MTDRTLFDTYTLGSLVLSNRVVLAPPVETNPEKQS